MAKKEKSDSKGMEKFIVRMDKLEGRVEMFEQFKEAIFDRISQLSEGIGDLRRMILDREKTLTEMEAKTEKMSEISKEFDPKVLRKRSENIKAEIQTMEMKREKDREFMEAMNSKIKEMEKLLSRVKSFENFVKESKNIGEKLEEINKTKRYVDRIGAKVEGIFADANEKIARIKSLTSTIQKVDDLTSELVKEFDRFKVMFEDEAVKGGDVDDLRNEIEDKIKDSISSELTPSIKKRMDYIEKLFLDIKKHKITPEDVRFVKKELNEIRRNRKSIKEMEEEKAKLEEIIGTAHEDFSDGLISKKAFDEITGKNRERIEEINVTINRVSNEMFAGKIRSMEETMENLKDSIDDLATKESLGDMKKRITGIEEGFRKARELFGRVSRMEKSFGKEKEAKENLTGAFNELRDNLNGFMKDMKDVRERVREQENEQKEMLENKIKRVQKELMNLLRYKAGTEELKEFEGRITDLIQKNTRVMEALMEDQLPKKEKKK